MINKKNILVVVLLLITSSCNLLPPSSPTHSKSEEIYDDNCSVSDTITFTNEKKFEDSMKKNGYLGFEINHIKEYSKKEKRCLDYKDFHNDFFEIFYWRDKNKIVEKYNLDSSNLNKRNIIKRLFTYYLTDSIIMSEYFYIVKDLDFNTTDKASVINFTIDRDSVFKLCKFKIIEIGKNKWKRVQI